MIKCAKCGKEIYSYKKHDYCIKCGRKENEKNKIKKYYYIKDKK